MHGYSAATYGDRFAEVYDEWYDDITDAEATAEVVATLARAAGGPPRVVELGIGTGRVALPLVARGVEVVGIDASESMLERLRAKAGAEQIAVHVADLGALGSIDVGPVGVALLAFNTLFNLTTEDAQLSCLTSCATWIGDHGAVIVEAFVPADDLGAVGRRLEPTRITADEVVLTVTDVDPDGHSVFGQHIHIRESGITLRPWQLRMLGTDDLDDLATRAGLVLVDRWSNWERDRFGPESDRHVSVYRRS